MRNPVRELWRAVPNVCMLFVFIVVHIAAFMLGRYCRPIFGQLLGVD